MKYLVKYMYKFGNTNLHYFYNKKDLDEYLDKINDRIGEEADRGKDFTDYKVYKFSNKDSVIDTLLNTINHSNLSLESDIVGDLTKI